MDEGKLNVNGGAIALGHPLGYGLVSMCVGGGMGAAGIFERLA